MSDKNSLDEVVLHHLIVTYGNRPGLPYSAQIVLLLRELQGRRSSSIQKTSAEAAAGVGVTDLAGSSLTSKERSDLIETLLEAHKKAYRHPFDIPANEAFTTAYIAVLDAMRPATETEVRCSCGVPLGRRDLPHLEGCALKTNCNEAKASGVDE